MKKAIFTLAAVLGIFIGHAQTCTPTGLANPGVSPPPDSIACIERGVYYEQIMQLKNFSTQSASGLDITFNSTRIDSLTNFPCGIHWETNKVNNTYSSGETGCIRVYGTTTDPVGQYPLQIYMTINITVSYQGTPLGTQDVNGEVSQLLSQLQQNFGISLPIDVSYVSRVIESGNPCPAIDPNASMTSSGSVCPVVSLSVNIGGNTSICTGETTMLTANPVDAQGIVSYNWSNGSTSPTITVSGGTYTVTADDGSTTATATTTVTENPAPTAGFTVDTSGMDVSITNQATNATNITYEYGDGTNSTTATTHTYDLDGPYTIIQIVSNACGSDTATQNITIGTVGIASLNVDHVSLDIIPNPNNGNFEISLTSDKLRAEYTMNIIDLQGKVVFNKTITTNSKIIRERLDLTDLPKGVYSVRLNAENLSYIRKLVIY